MGQEITSAQFSQSDFAEFQELLTQETKILSQWFQEEVFAEDQHCCGFELEGWILDKDELPTPLSENLLESINDPRVVPELSRYNFEFNSKP
jgi:hypothetical protein